MKRASTALVTPILCGLLLAGFPAVRAQTGSITVPSEGGGFVVNRYDTETGGTTYEVTFTRNGVTSIYEIGADGFANALTAGSERYRFLYRTKNRKLRKVKLVSSGGGVGRKLDAGSEALGDAPDNATTMMVDGTATTPLGEAAATTTPAHAGRGRRLLECDECQQTWDTVCDNGVLTVCNLVDYGDPILPAGADSIDVFCNDFGGLCEAMVADEVCADECVEVEPGCLAPLTITLEYEGAGPLDVGLLDLYVIEPGGQTAYWETSVTDRGYLSSTDNSMSYTMYTGLNADSSTGSFIAFAEWYEGPAPISWTMTATSGSGDVLVEKEGQFTGECGSSSGVPDASTGTGVSPLVFVEFDDYVDNGCEGGADAPEFPYIVAGGGRRA